MSTKGDSGPCNNNGIRQRIHNTRILSFSTLIFFALDAIALIILKRRKKTAAQNTETRLKVNSIFKSVMEFN